MFFKKFRQKQILIGLIGIALVPIFITVYEVIFAGNKSVRFLGNYPPQIATIVMAFYVLLLGMAVFWFITQLILFNRMKHEQAKTELLFLKSQVSPHFFFNMLNNLYGLVTKDSKQAQMLILKLSDLMRYSIYEGERETVTVQEEADYLRNYIDLHKMRYHKQISVNFNYYIEDNCRIIPLLFIMLLENSFKHGVENLTEKAYVNVDMKSVKDEIHFMVENNFDPSLSRKNKPGIGLENLKRRLELSYPGKHDLAFSITKNIYKVKLVLSRL